MNDISPTDIDDLNRFFLGPIRNANVKIKHTISKDEMVSLRNAIFSQDMGAIKSVVYPLLLPNFQQDARVTQDVINALLRSGKDAFIDKTEERAQMLRERIYKKNVLIAKATSSLPEELSRKIASYVRPNGGKRKSRRGSKKKRKTRRV